MDKETFNTKFNQINENMNSRRIVLCIVCLMAAIAWGQQPVVKVEGGQIQGIPSASSGITVFKGIPYAAPPVGDLRWKRPQPVVKWKGVRKADTFSNICWQPGNAVGTFYGNEFYWKENTVQSEDCLYLNIWTPTDAVAHQDKKLPVAFWVHGGAYFNGYGHEITMDGDAWAKRGVILVTINYRLGIFGFLAHPELSAETSDGTSGNYGTYDQVAALRWAIVLICPSSAVLPSVLPNVSRTAFSSGMSRLSACNAVCQLSGNDSACAAASCKNVSSR